MAGGGNMKNLLFMVVFTVCACCIPLMAFDADQYDFSSTTHTYSSIYGTGNQSSIVNWIHGGDDELSDIIPLGFNFPFCGEMFNSIRISSNGFITLDTGLFMSYPNNGLTQDIEVPIIAPLWDDLDSGAPAPNTSSTYVLYQSSIPNRFTVEWRNVRWIYNGESTYSQNFQVVLDASGSIRFNYGSSGTINNPSASIGLTNDDHFISITPNNTFSTTVSNDNVDIFPTNRQFLFSPPPPGLTLSSPNGGENWQMRTVQAITWSFLNLTGNLKIELVRGEAAIPVFTINSSVPVNSQLVNWILPTTLSVASDYRIKISSLSIPEITDISNGYFTISEAGDQLITVLSPNGGENWEMGDTQTITWSSQGVVGNIKCTLCKGENYTEVLTIISSLPITNEIIYWNMPTTLQAGEDYRIKISSLSNPNVVDYSDQYFNIPPLPAPTLTLNSPNGGESWYLGSSHVLSWSSLNLTGNIKVELYRGEESNPVQVITSSVAANVGAINWTIPLTLSAGENYRIKLCSLSNPAVWDVSDTPFSLMVPLLLVISPNGGEDWFLGSTQTISWNYAYLPGNVRIDLIRGASLTPVHTFSTTTPTVNGMINCIIPNTIEPATDYRIKLSSVSASYIYDVSDGYFTISNPVLELTAPNGGEVWRIGQEVNILWNAANISGNARIELYRGLNTNPVGFISQGVDVSTQSYSWTVPNTLIPATDYRCKIILLNNSAIYDYSNSAFSILGSPYISLNAPNGGENWSLSTTRQISWSYANISGNAKILLYNTELTEPVLTISPWVALSNNVLNWTLPSYNLPIGNYYVEIRSLSDPSVFDTSYAPFAISYPTVNFNEPNNSASWQAGSTHPVNWDGNYLAGALMLELVQGTNNTLICVIRSSINAGAGTLNWAIPSTINAATDYRIRATMLNNPSFISFSESFIITNNPSLQLSSPNGAESWSMGTTKVITWDTAFVSGNVTLELCRGAANTVVHTITNDCPASSESFNWSIPLTLSSANDYRIKISSNGNPALYDYSNAVFAISAPQLQLVSPNGGESWIRGQQSQIRWTYANITGNLNVELYRGEAMEFVTTISTAAAINTNSFNWNIPSALALGTDYRIKISSINIPAISDVSENVFSLVGTNAPLTAGADISQVPPYIYPDTSAPYEVKCRYFDPDGTNDLKTLYLRIVNPYNNSITFNYNPTGNTYGTWAGNQGANHASLSAVSKNYVTDNLGRIGWEVCWKFFITNPNWAGCADELKFATMAMDNSDNLSNSGVWVESSQTSSFANYGISFLCAGFSENANNTKQGWQYEMADAIKNRLGGHAFIGKYNPQTGLFDTYYDNADSPEQKELILVFDWMEDELLDADGFAEAAADAAFAALQPFCNLGNINNLHLIGHSRGAVVISELTERLLQHNRPVRQVTYLDPHDWGLGNVGDDFEVNQSLPSPYYPLSADIPVGIPTHAVLGWQGVPYIETIFQRHGSDYPTVNNLDDSNGRAVAGTSNACFADNYTVNHLGIAEQYINSIRSADYVFYLRPSEDPTASKGYQRSRIGNVRMGYLESFPRSGEATQSADYTAQDDAVFNGDFNFYSPIEISGWSLHGGCVQHCVMDQDAESGTYGAKLSQSAESDAILRHNRLFVSRNSSYLRFKYKVITPSANATLRFCIDEENPLLEIPLTHTGDVFLEREIDISAYQRRNITFSFIIPASLSAPFAIVLLDDIRICHNSVGLDDEYLPDEPGQNSIPAINAITLHGAFPNPFSDRTNIRFGLKQAQFINSTIYDISGRKVRSNGTSWFPEGENFYPWDRCDDEGNPVPSGVYIIRVQGPGGSATRKMTILK